MAKSSILRPVLTIASIIPSPIQPFALAANAAISVHTGNWLGAGLSLFGLSQINGFARIGDTLSNVGSSASDAFSNWSSSFDDAVASGSGNYLGSTPYEYIDGSTYLGDVSGVQDLGNAAYQGAVEATMAGQDPSQWLAQNYGQYDTSAILDKVNQANWADAGQYLNSTEDLAQGFGSTSQNMTGFDTNANLGLGSTGSVDPFSNQVGSLSTDTLNFTDTLNPSTTGSMPTFDSSGQALGFDYIDGGSVIQGDPAIDALTTGGASQWGAPYEDGSSFVEGFENLTNPLKENPLDSWSAAWDNIKDLGSDPKTLLKLGAGMYSDYNNTQTQKMLRDAISQYGDPFAQQRADATARLNNSYNNPESLWNEYMAGQGANYLNNAAAQYAKAGRRNMLPQLTNMARQNFYNSYLPQYRQLNDPSRFGVNSGVMSGALAGLSNANRNAGGNTMMALADIFSKR